MKKIRWLVVARPRQLLFHASIGCAMLTGMSAVSGASFDCRRAHSDAEIVICSDATLSALDEEVAALYRKALDRSADRQALVVEGRRRWREREQNCHDKTCVANWLYARRKELTTPSSRSEALVDAAAVTQPKSQANSSGALNADHRDMFITQMREGSRRILAGTFNFSACSTLSDGDTYCSSNVSLWAPPPLQTPDEPTVCPLNAEFTMSFRGDELRSTTCDVSLQAWLRLAEEMRNRYGQPKSKSDQVMSMVSESRVWCDRETYVELMRFGGEDLSGRPINKFTVLVSRNLPEHCR